MSIKLYYTKFLHKVIMYIILSNTNIYYFVECNKPVKKTSSLILKLRGKAFTVVKSLVSRHCLTSSSQAVKLDFVKLELKEM